jgi:hypothetical protein
MPRGGKSVAAKIERIRGASLSPTAEATDSNKLTGQRQIPQRTAKITIDAHVTIDPEGLLGSMR